MRFPHDRLDPTCVTQDALLSLVEAMDRLDDWHHSMTGSDTTCGPCLRDLDVSPRGRLTAHVTLEFEGGLVLLEYHDGRWEMMQ